MKSLRVKVLAVMLVSSLLSLLAAVAVSRNTERTYLNPVFEAADQLQLQDAVKALKVGGIPAATTYLKDLDGLFGTSHHLLNHNGVDIVTSIDFRKYLPAAPAVKSRGTVNREFVVARRSSDGRYWFLSIGRQHSEAWIFYPYYIVILCNLVALAWLASFGIVSPIRRMTKVVEQFGEGHLKKRIYLKQTDEIGDLSRSFSQMADRLDHLLSNEKRLLQDISHELRAPLARLKFAVKLARSAPDLNTALDRVERDVDRIAVLVSQIVEMTRLEADPALFKPQPVRVDELLNEIAADCHLEAALRGCDLQLVIGSSCPVSGDRELLRRVLENVLRNAIRYSPEQSSVEIFLRCEASFATVEFRDYGPGVPPTMLDSIFDPFFRVEEARETGGGGVGLGLAIAKQAIQLHCGTIAAFNAHPGLRVRIEIPAANA